MKISIWVLLVVLLVLLSSLAYNGYQYSHPTIKDVVVTEKLSQSEIKKIKINAVNTYKTEVKEKEGKETKEKDKQDKLQKDADEKNNVFYINEKTYPIAQGLYKINGWLLTPAGHHIAHMSHGDPVYVQFNFLTTAAISPCGAKLTPIKVEKLTETEKRSIIQIGTKPSTLDEKHIQLTKGEEWTTTTECIISGDIKYLDNSGKWIRLYDTWQDYPKGQDLSDKTTTLVVVKTKGILIKAPYGATISFNISLETLKEQRTSEEFIIIIKEI
jgi:hypothetical protein